MKDGMFVFDAAVHCQDFSDGQIKDYLVGRYGDFVLMKPPLQPNTWVLWFGPVVVLAIAAGVATGVVAGARKRARTR